MCLPKFLHTRQYIGTRKEWYVVPRRKQKYAIIKLLLDLFALGAVLVLIVVSQNRCQGVCVGWGRGGLSLTVFWSCTVVAGMDGLNSR